MSVFFLSMCSVSSVANPPTASPSAPILPPGTPPQSPPCSQWHPPAAREPRFPPDSPARKHPPAPYTDRKPESSLSESRCQTHRAHSHYKSTSACHVERDSVP